jgi:hypothetical protein
MNQQKDIFDFEIEEKKEDPFDKMIQSESRMPDIFDTDEEFDETLIKISGFAPPEELPERSTTENILRQTGRTVANVGERTVGLPGDIYQLLKTGAKKLGIDVTPEQELNFAQKFARNFFEKLPTEEDIQAQITEVWPEREPESKGEKQYDEFIKVATDFANPIGGNFKLGKSLGLSALGSATEEVVDLFKGEDTTKNIAKLGTMTLASMFDRGRGIRSHINKLYQASENFIPKNAKASYSVGGLNKAESIIRKGTMLPYKETTMKLINDIKSKIRSGEMSVADMVQIDKDINRLILDAGKDKQKIGLIKQVKKAHTQNLKEYAKTNPSWGEAYAEAKLAEAGIKTSRDLQEYIKKEASLKNFTYGSVLLGTAENLLPGSMVASLAGAGLITGATLTTEILRRIAKNPALRRYYTNVLTAAANENKVSLMRNLEGLERVAKKEFSNDPLFQKILERDKEELE